MISNDVCFVFWVSMVRRRRVIWMMMIWMRVIWMMMIWMWSHPHHYEHCHQLYTGSWDSPSTRCTWWGQNVQWVCYDVSSFYIYRYCLCNIIYTRILYYTHIIRRTHINTTSPTSLFVVTRFTVGRMSLASDRQTRNQNHIRVVLVWYVVCDVSPAIEILPPTNQPKPATLDATSSSQFTPTPHSYTNHKTAQRYCIFCFKNETKET